jgi:tyrosyl-tRNA synthetase
VPPTGAGSLALASMEASGARMGSTAVRGGPPRGGSVAAWLERDAVDSLPAGELERKLALGRPLRVKLGIDPTAPDIHLGHTVVLAKLREFQEAGHVVVLIVGDFTARIGDPSGRSETRPVLSIDEIDRNARTYQEQAFAILDRGSTEVRHNSEWLDMSMGELFQLARSMTVSQVIEREDFATRLREGSPIALLELFYPLLQGYDSVAVRADVELGGTDQKFNLLRARDIQRAYGVSEQAIMTMPILPGTDGTRRMAKSLRNYIGVAEPPGEIYGKTLSIPDTAIEIWYRLLLDSSFPADLTPRDAKRALARALVARFHGPEAAEEAEREFDRVHIDRQAPEEIPEVSWEAPDSRVVHLPALLAAAFGITTSEARRNLAQGAVRLDGTRVANGTLDLPAHRLAGKVLQLGKRRFARVRLVAGGG